MCRPVLSIRMPLRRSTEPVPTTATPCEISGESSGAETAQGAALRLLSGAFDDHYARVFHYLSHRFFDRELAEELTAETFCRAAGAADRFEGGAGQLRVWLLRLATNVANTHHRRVRWRRRLLDAFVRARPTATGPDSSSGSANAVDQDPVRAVLQGLPSRHQAVLVLRFYSQMSFDDIAGILGCRPDAARARLSRAVKEMRKRLGADDASRSPNA